MLALTNSNADLSLWFQFGADLLIRLFFSFFFVFFFLLWLLLVHGFWFFYLIFNGLSPTAHRHTAGQKKREELHEMKTKGKRRKRKLFARRKMKTIRNEWMSERKICCKQETRSTLNWGKKYVEKNNTDIRCQSFIILCHLCIVVNTLHMCWAVCVCVFVFIFTYDGELVLGFIMTHDLFGYAHAWNFRNSIESKR